VFLALINGRSSPSTTRYHVNGELLPAYATDFWTDPALTIFDFNAPLFVTSA
jgi:hypothetical protein